MRSSADALRVGGDLARVERLRAPRRRARRGRRRSAGAGPCSTRLAATRSALSAERMRASTAALIVGIGAPTSKRVLARPLAGALLLRLVQDQVDERPARLGVGDAEDRRAVISTRYERSSPRVPLRRRARRAPPAGRPAPRDAAGRRPRRSAACRRTRSRCGPSSRSGPRRAGRCSRRRARRPRPWRRSRVRIGASASQASREPPGMMARARGARPPRRPRRPCRRTAGPRPRARGSDARCPGRRSCRRRSGCRPPRRCGRRCAITSSTGLPAGTIVRIRRGRFERRHQPLGRVDGLDAAALPRLPRRGPAPSPGRGRSPPPRSRGSRCSARGSRPSRPGRRHRSLESSPPLRAGGDRHGTASRPHAARRACLGVAFGPGFDLDAGRVEVAEVDPLADARAGCRSPASPGCAASRRRVAAS